MYPGGFAKYPDRIGIFLAGNQAKEKENQTHFQHKFRITIVNQHSHKESITAGKYYVVFDSQKKTHKKDFKAIIRTRFVSLNSEAFFEQNSQKTKDSF